MEGRFKQVLVNNSPINFTNDFKDKLSLRYDVTRLMLNKLSMKLNELHSDDEIAFNNNEFCYKAEDRKFYRIYSVEEGVSHWSIFNVDGTGNIDGVYRRFYIDNGEPLYKSKVVFQNGRPIKSTKWCTAGRDNGRFDVVINTEYIQITNDNFTTKKKTCATQFPVKTIAELAL